MVWKLGPPRFEQVYEDPLKHRKVYTTTVMTMMNILEQKGYLQEARATGRSFILPAGRKSR